MACDGDEAPDTAGLEGDVTPSATAEDAMTPEVMPTTVTETPGLSSETGGMDGFRSFAQQVEQAVVNGDAQFFIDRARISEITCPEEPQEVMDRRCLGEPEGTVIVGVFAGPAEPALLTLGSLREDLGGYLDSLADPTLYAIGDESSWASEPDTLANYHGFENAFYAVVTSSDDPPNTTRVLTFEFRSEDGRWLLALVRTTGSPVEAEDWLSGNYTEWYDHWERWEGAP
jgi:hypothetical protein